MPTSPRTFGVEEELLLLDAATGLPRPLAEQVIAGCAASADLLGGPEVKHEFFLEQVEIATRPCRTTKELARQLAAGRRSVAEAAAPLGAVPVAVPLSVLGPAQGTPTPGERYQRILQTYGQIATDSLFCALQVHVQVHSDAEAIGVVDRMRPWTPLLLALSANSPWWQGTDTGFASWRSQLWDRWPSSGPREPFKDMATYRATAADLIRSGAALDEGLLNFDLRPSARYPTVELRVTDVCTDLQDAVALAALARALVATTAGHWALGVPAPQWSVQQLADAREGAARAGVDGSLVSPVTGRACSLLEALTEVRKFAHEALRETGDADVVEAAAERWLEHGNGASRQRTVWAAEGNLDAVVRDLASRTLAAVPRPPDESAVGRSGGDRLEELADLFLREVPGDVGLGDHPDQVMTVDHG